MARTKIATKAKARKNVGRKKSNGRVTKAGNGAGEPTVATELVELARQVLEADPTVSANEAVLRMVERTGTTVCRRGKDKPTLLVDASRRVSIDGSVYHNHEAESAVLRHHAPEWTMFTSRPLGDLLVAALGSAADPHDDRAAGEAQDGREFGVHALHDIAGQLTTIASWMCGGQEMDTPTDREAFEVLIRLAKRVRATAEILKRLTVARQELWKQPGEPYSTPGQSEAAS